MTSLPKDISQLTDKELNDLVEAIRERRNKPLAEYKSILALKQKAAADKVSAKVEKELAMFAKKLAIVDKHLTELENRAVKIIALRLELGDVNVGQYLHGESPSKSA